MGERIGIDVVNMIYDTAENITEQFQNNYDELKLELLRVMALDLPYTEEEFKEFKPQEQVEKVFEAAIKSFKRKSEKLAEIAQPVIKQVFENQGAMYENILIPITDGKKVYNISCNLKEAYESGSKALVKAFQKSILLHTIDENWKEHLREMDDLRQSVQNASYEQKDPLLIYKLESFNLFKVMIENVNSKSVSVLMRGQIPIREPEQVKKANIEEKTDYSKYRTEKEDSSGKSDTAKTAATDTRERRPEPVRVEKKVGRNDPCPCGSGKKYKSCHGR
jgi:preprotein translocase subunit SecA